MNKNYIYAGMGVATAIIIVVALSGSASMTLDQILEAKDCEALDKWGDKYLYDENLNLTDKQQSGIMKLGFTCGMNVAKNMLGNWVLF